MNLIILLISILIFSSIKSMDNSSNSIQLPSLANIHQVGVIQQNGTIAIITEQDLHLFNQKGEAIKEPERCSSKIQGLVINQKTGDIMVGTKNGSIKCYSNNGTLLQKIHTELPKQKDYWLFAVNENNNDIIALIVNKAKDNTYPYVRIDKNGKSTKLFSRECGFDIIMDQKNNHIIYEELVDHQHKLNILDEKGIILHTFDLEGSETEMALTNAGNIVLQGYKHRIVDQYGNCLKKFETNEKDYKGLTVNQRNNVITYAEKVGRDFYLKSMNENGKTHISIPLELTPTQKGSVLSLHCYERTGAIIAHAADLVAIYQLPQVEEKKWCLMQ